MAPALGDGAITGVPLGRRRQHQVARMQVGHGNGRGLAGQQHHNRRKQERRPRTHGHQAVHLGSAAQQGRDAGREDALPWPGQNGGGQDHLHPVQRPRADQAGQPVVKGRNQVAAHFTCASVTPRREDRVGVMRPEQAAQLIPSVDRRVAIRSWESPGTGRSADRTVIMADVRRTAPGQGKSNAKRRRELQEGSVPCYGQGQSRRTRD